MFRGRFEHVIDEKGRLAIPSRFRDILCTTTEEPTIVLTNFDRCLLAYSLDEWLYLEKKVATLPQFEPKVLAFIRYFISGAIECTLDKAGRVLIPGHLRQLAKIEKDCVICGQINRFEIWSLNDWQKEFNCISDQFTNLATALSAQGISL